MSRNTIHPKVPKGTTLVIHPNRDEDLIFPAALLAAGELVAFPTETVYGLGADATDETAVAKIFKAKGRPSDNPLIVHVAQKSDIKDLVLEINPLAECLMNAFMPGPITLVMNKSSKIPDLVSAGLLTVGIRMPSHPIAERLIRLAGVPVAAPSANVSGSPSPTRAEHVEKDLTGKIPCIVDGGPCEVGLESTVVDVTGTWPVILRPGAVTLDMIVDVCLLSGIAAPDVAVMTHDQVENGEAPRAPGMKYRHYAPRAALSIVMPAVTSVVSKDRNDVLAAFLSKVREALLEDDGSTIGVFCGKETSVYMKKELSAASQNRVFFYLYGRNTDIEGAARGLFDGIRSLDEEGVKHIFAAGFAGNGLVKAYMNRLEKAAGDKKELDPLESYYTSHTRNVLFVCTGNTCRSPMAEAIFNILVKRNGDYTLKGESDTRVTLIGSSAGIFAENGSPAASNAAEAVRTLYGADLSGHRSRKIKKEMLEENDLILAVTSEHAAMLRRISPDNAGKMYSFSEYLHTKSIYLPLSETLSYTPDIPDPFGRDIGVYIKTARRLYDLLSAMWLAVLADLGIEILP